jgi:tripartite-type tricarboxylate transporter receptor subunit TctC
MLTRRNVLAGTAGLAALGLTRSAFAQAWPQKTVTILCPFAAGGNTDGIARMAALRLQETLGQSFIVENRAGAGGAIAADQTARAQPDGYTLMIAALPVMAIVPHINKVKYNPLKDFAPISNIATNPFVLVVNKDFPARTLPEFIAHVRSQPGKFSYGSAGIGSLNHLSMALFLKMAGLDMVHIIYRGNAPALADIVAGHIPAMFSNLSDALPQISGGTVRAIAVSGEKRSSALPNVPSVAESGYPEFKTLTWNGLIAPKGTPPEVIDRISKEMAVAVKDKAFADKLASYGVDPLGSSPDDFAKTIAADVAFWGSAVDAAGVKQQ